MASTEDNTIINIFKDKRSDFLEKYYGDHSYDELIGGRIINNNILQLRQSLGGVFDTDGNIELFSKLNPKIKKVEIDSYNVYRSYLIVDLFVFNIKNKEEHEKYWNEFIKVYNVKNSKSEDFEFPCIYIGLGRDDDNHNAFGITLETHLGFTAKDFKHFKMEDTDSFTPLEGISIEGTKSFLRFYAIFDIQDKKAKKEMEKYYNLDYGLDKFEKKVF